jgi:uncharacterized membrane protein
MDAQAKSVRQLLHTVLLSKGRVEALTDGIFAIAMTLLVLELKVPDLAKSAGSYELLHRLGEEAPAWMSFLISFMYCGLLWLLHHLAMHFVRHMQVALVWLNLLFLMSISVLPFSCALLGHFVRNRAAVEIYFGNVLLSALLLWTQWLFARKRKLINDDDPRAAEAMGMRLTAVPVAIAAGMLATFYRPLAGFYAMAIVLVAFRARQRRVLSKRVQPTGPSISAS